MIYIFDDRQERREEHKPCFNQYTHQLTWASFTADGNLQEYVTEEFGDAEIIIMHASYRFPSNNYTLDDVLNACKGTPIVLFSGGISSASISKEDIYRVNSNSMYENLTEFLDARKTDTHVPLEMLLWGKDFIKNQFLILLYEINKFCVEKGINATIDPYAAIDAIEDKLRFNTLCKDRDRLIKWIEDTDGSLTYADLIEAIETIMHR